MVRDDAQNRRDLNSVSTVAEDERLESALHRGNFLDPGKGRIQPVKDLSGINSIQIPPDWLKVEKNSPLGDSTIFRHSLNDNTQISFYSDRSPTDPKSASVFKSLVDSAGPTPKLLYGKSSHASNEANIHIIKQLSDALGSTLVGDNQLTAGNERTPAFHLDSARVETINGKNVIAVDGWFSRLDDKADVIMDSNGPAKRRYTGIFFDSAAAHSKETKIKELYLLADDNISFVGNKATFKTALKSIEWK
jgi:hypothetical protein